MQRSFTSAIFIFVLFFICDVSFSQENLHETAKKFMEEKKYQKAIETYQKILLQTPGDFEIQKDLAKVYSWLNDYDESIKIYDSILKKYPDDLDIKLQLGLVYAWKTDYDKAEHIFKDIIESSDSYYDAYISLARVYYWKSEYKKSISILERTENKFSENAESMILKVNVYYANGNYKKAKFYNSKLLYFDPLSQRGLEFAKILKLNSFEIGYNYDNLSVMDDWEEKYVSFEYKPNRNNSVFLNAGFFNRFSLKDRKLDLGYKFMLINKIIIESGFGIGFDNKFLPKNRVNASIGYEMFKGTVLNIGMNYLKFNEGYVNIYITGTDLYLPKNFYFTYRYYYSSGDINVVSSTNLLSINKIFFNDSRLSLGYSSGGEVFHVVGKQDLNEFKSNSVFMNLQLRISGNFKIRLSFINTDREGSYNRKTYGSSIFYLF
ncbi:YaiO family outer membrane beta-barrel protein [candidate division KSB1 bacterium]